MPPKKTKKATKAVATANKKQSAPPKFALCPYTNQKVFIVRATLKDLKSKATYSNGGKKRLWLLASPGQRNDILLESASAIASVEQSILPSFGGRSWEVVCSLSDAPQMLFRAYKGRMELAALPHLLEKIPTPPIWPGRRKSDPDEYCEGGEDDDCKKLLDREVSTLSTVAWEVRGKHPVPQVSLKWKSPDHRSFTSRKAAWEYATTMARRETVIHKHLLGIGASGKLLQPSFPSAKTTLEVGLLRFERDGLWVVGQELSWQEDRPELLEEEKQQQQQLLLQQRQQQLALQKEGGGGEDEATPIVVEKRKRQVTGLSLYLVETRAQYRQQHDDCDTLRQAEMELRKVWKTLSDEEREEWNNKANAERQGEESNGGEQESERVVEEAVEEALPEPPQEPPRPAKRPISVLSFYIQSRRQEYRKERRLYARRFTLADADSELREIWKTLSEVEKDVWRERLEESLPPSQRSKVEELQDAPFAKRRRQDQQQPIQSKALTATTNEQQQTVNKDVDKSLDVEEEKKEDENVGSASLSPSKAVVEVREVLNSDAGTMEPQSSSTLNAIAPGAMDTSLAVEPAVVNQTDETKMDGNGKTQQNPLLPNSDVASDVTASKLSESGTTKNEESSLPEPTTAPLAMDISETESAPMNTFQIEGSAPATLEAAPVGMYTSKTGPVPIATIKSQIEESSSDEKSDVANRGSGDKPAFWKSETTEEAALEQDQTLSASSASLMQPITSASGGIVITKQLLEQPTKDCKEPQHVSSSNLGPSKLLKAAPKKPNRRRLKTTAKEAQRWCLNRDQIDLCYDACMEHYEQVMRTVKVRDLQRELQDGFDLLRERGRGRFDMELPTFELEPFKFLTDLQEAPWMPVVRTILGNDVVLIHKGCFLSMPGAETQEYHQDGVHLTTQTQRPCHAINVFVPLVDLTTRNGPTEFCLGSQVLGHEDYDRDFIETPKPKAGTPVIFDYRLGHRGLGNSSMSCRPVVYCTYARASDGKAFRDSVNFSRRRYHKIGELIEKPLSRAERSHKRKRSVQSREEAELKKALELSKVEAARFVKTAEASPGSLPSAATSNPHAERYEAMEENGSPKGKGTATVDLKENAIASP